MESTRKRTTGAGESTHASTRAGSSSPPAWPRAKRSAHPAAAGPRPRRPAPRHARAPGTSNRHWNRTEDRLLRGALARIGRLLRSAALFDADVQPCWVFLLHCIWVLHGARLLLCSYNVQHYGSQPRQHGQSATLHPTWSLCTVRPFSRVRACPLCSTVNIRFVV